MTTKEAIRNEILSELLLAKESYNPDSKDDNIRIVEDVRKAVDEMADGINPSAKHIAELAVAAKENIQVRDFLMGLRAEKDFKFVGEYLEYMVELIKKDYSYPLATVLTTYFYEHGASDTAKDLLDQVLDIDPEYALGKLLQRVYAAEWPAESMADMAKELHHKIIDTIYETEESDDNNN